MAWGIGGPWPCDRWKVKGEKKEGGGVSRFTFHFLCFLRLCLENKFTIFIVSGCRKAA